MPKKAKRITQKAMVKAAVKRQPFKRSRQEARRQIRDEAPLPTRNFTMLFNVVFPQPVKPVVYTRP